MKLTTLKIQNFLSIYKATLNLADKGLVSIEGVNGDSTGGDSNGSGKSGVINSILYCVTGNYGKAGSADDVVNSSIGKDCMVETVWDDGARAYSIIRYRKHSKHKNAVKVSVLERPTPESGITGWKDITKAGAQAVQEQIYQIIGANEMVFRASCFSQQEDAVDIPGMTDKELKELLEAVLPLEDTGEYHPKAVKQRQEQSAVIDAIKRKLWEVEHLITHSKAELKASLDARLNYTNEVDAKNASIEKAIKAKKLAYGVALTTANVGTIPDELAALKKKELEVADANTGKAEVELRFVENEVNTLKDKLLNQKNRCGECGQEIRTSTDYVEKIKRQLSRANARLETTRRDFERISRNATLLSSIRAAIGKLERSLLEAKRNGEAAAHLKAEISLLERSKVTAGENPHEAAVTRHRDALKAAMGRKKDLEASLKEATDKLELFKAVELTFSPKGLRYHILENVAPRLTEATNKYLHTLTDGAISAVWSTVSRTGAGEFREKFSIEARMDGRSKFALLSGGEKRKVRLACFFALQDLIASQATKHIDIWIADEIDHALDPAGMERLMGLLNEKALTKSTILVISHNQLGEWISNSAVVTRKDGVSTISGILNA